MAFDPHYASVSLLLHCDGADGSTAFTDSSPTPKAITVNGNARISTAQSKFGGASGDFDGLGDYLVSSGDFGSLGSSDWAIEFWVYYRNLTNFPHIVNIGTSTTNRLTLYAQAGVMRVFTEAGGSPGTRITSSTTDSTLQWIHYALARSGATMTLYRNGIAVGTSTTTALPTGASQLAIGWQHFGGTTTDYLNGYIDDLRITKGIARYAAGFTPPTGPFPDSATVPADSVSLLLHCDGADGSTTFTDSSPAPKTVTAGGNAKISTAQSKFGGASIYFGGSADWVSVTNNAAFGFGLADFTVEAWIYITGGQGSDRCITDFRKVNGSEAAGFFIDGPAGNKLAVWYGAKLGGSGRALSTGVWYHVALSRSAGVFRCFVDGVLDWTATATVDFGATRPLGIGGAVHEVTPGVVSSPFFGHIDDLRITKGIARYTANFTPPTGPFPDSATPPIVSAHAACTTPLGLPQALAEFAGAARVRASSPGPLAAPSVVVSSAESFEAAVFESIASTVFGTPALTASCKALSIGDTTSFGTPIATTFTPPKIHRTTDAASVYTTKFGTPSVALGAWVVEAGSTAPGTTFGAPVAGTAQAAQPISPSAAFGLPISGIALQASGFCSTVFSVPVSGRALRADSIAPAGRWGPVAATTYYEHVADSIPGSPQFGVPSTHRRFLAQAMAPTTRFGKPLLQRGVMC